MAETTAVGATVPTPNGGWNGYPTSSRRDVSETDPHRTLLTRLIDMLTLNYAADPSVYVSGNLPVFYEQGNRHRHLSPDVFVVRGAGNRPRMNYLTWEEPHGPEFVIEILSSSTHNEDTNRKLRLYRRRLRVQEFFLFDMQGTFLTERLQGYRLDGARYRRITPLSNGRVQSVVTGLCLEEQGESLGLWDQRGARYLLTHAEQAEAERDALRAERDALRAERDALLAQLRGRNGQHGP